MITPYVYAAARQAEEQRQQALQEGTHRWLLRHTQPARLRLRDRLVAGLGALLVRSGEALCARCVLSGAILRHTARPASE